MNVRQPVRTPATADSKLRQGVAALADWAGDDWLRQELAAGLAKLSEMNMQGRPAAQDLAVVANLWLERLEKRIWVGVYGVAAFLLAQMGEALIHAAVQLEGTRGPLDVVAGAVPRPGEHPVGCRFRPRCREATAICGQTKPELLVDGCGGMVRCWHRMPGDEEAAPC